MKTPYFKISQNKYILLILLMVLLWLFLHHRVSQLDERFFQPSLLGIKGLVLYEMGDYSGAAKAYRAHFREAYQTERTSSDPAYDALLRGDLKAAKEISQKALEKNPSDFSSLLTLGEVLLEEGDLDRFIEAERNL